ncbi:MAG: cyclase family protein, partial [Sphingobium sp.]
MDDGPGEQAMNDMGHRWKRRPAGSTWGDFGDADQIGRMNLLTPAIRKAAAAEIIEGRAFTLSLPLDYPGGSVLSANRKPPELRAGRLPGGGANYGFHASCISDGYTDVFNDDAVLLHTQYSTQWDALSHYGCEFDADDDGVEEVVYYNGYAHDTAIRDATECDGGIGAVSLGIENLAMAGVQGRGVLIDLKAVYGDRRHGVGYDDLMTIMAAQNVEVGRGDFLCLYTGFADIIMDMAGKPDGARLKSAC